MKFNKVFLGLATISFAALSMLVIPTAVVRADDSITQDNLNTGNKSVNKNKTRIKRETKITKITKAKVKNEVTGKANTGGNESKNNTTGGTVTSGAVAGTVDLTNDVNQPTDPACCCGAENAPLAANVDQSNENTGHKSVNKNKAKVTDNFTCKEVNKAKVKNDVSLTGNTGKNKATGNTTSGDVASGDVTFGITIANTVN